MFGDISETKTKDLSILKFSSAEVKPNGPYIAIWVDAVSWPQYDINLDSHIRRRIILT